MTKVIATTGEVEMGCGVSQTVSFAFPCLPPCYPAGHAECVRVRAGCCCNACIRLRETGGTPAVHSLTASAGEPEGRGVARNLCTRYETGQLCLTFEPSAFNSVSAIPTCVKLYRTSRIERRTGKPRFSKGLSFATQQRSCILFFWDCGFL
jgi:hypothetical protein